MIGHTGEKNGAGEGGAVAQHAHGISHLVENGKLGAVEEEPSHAQPLLLAQRQHIRPVADGSKVRIAIDEMTQSNVDHQRLGPDCYEMMADSY